MLHEQVSIFVTRLTISHSCYLHASWLYFFSIGKKLSVLLLEIPWTLTGTLLWNKQKQALQATLVLNKKKIKEQLENMLEDQWWCGVPWSLHSLKCIILKPLKYMEILNKNLLTSSWKLNMGCVCFFSRRMIQKYYTQPEERKIKLERAQDSDEERVFREERYVSLYGPAL